MKVKVDDLPDGRKSYTIWCPACEETHVINNSWGFDGNLDNPTFDPSILVTSGHYVPGFDGGDCWCTYNEKHPEKKSSFKCSRCHSFLENGTWRYLADSSHEYAGMELRAVNLPVSSGR